MVWVFFQFKNLLHIVLNLFHFFMFISSYKDFSFSPSFPSCVRPFLLSLPVPIHLLTPLFGTPKGVEDPRQFNYSQRGNFLSSYLSILLFRPSSDYPFTHSSHLFPSHLFMLTQEVSKMPISLSTPSRMSLMTSGGMRRERISDRASGLMFPTARLASSTKG